MNDVKRGISLAIAMTMVLLLLFLTIVSTAVLNSSNMTRGNVYIQTVAINASRSGVQRVSAELFRDAENSFTRVLSPEYVYKADQEIIYTIGTFSADFEVTIEDNDDLDADPLVDTDQRLIISSTGRVVQEPLVIGQTRQRVFAAYLGTAGEYAQTGGSSKSTSAFSGEINIGSHLGSVSEADPNQ